MAVWYSFWSFGIFFPFWYVWTNKSGNPACCREHIQQALKSLEMMDAAFQCGSSIAVLPKNKFGSRKMVSQSNSNQLIGSYARNRGANVFGRVARFFLTQYTRTGEIVPNCH
jgi:hypothetical protein